MDEIKVETYSEKDEAKFTAYLDVQLEFEDFIEFNDEITEKIEKELNIN